MHATNNYTHRCVMCGGYSWAPWRSDEKIQCINDKCRYYGDTVVPFTSMISFEQYKDKEQDMCNATKRWGVVIEPGSKNSDGSDTYYVRFDHKDKNTTDQMTRSFDTFEDALAFANGQYDVLK